MDSKELIPVQSKELVQEAREFCSSITEIIITTENEYVNNCEITKKVTEYSNKIEKLRKILLAPFDQKKKEINTYFKEAQNPLKNLREKLRASLSNYTIEQERKKAEELHLRSTVRQDMAENVVPVEIPKEVPKVEGISYRKNWSAKVVDKIKFIEYCAQHNKYEYLEVNMGLLNKFAKDFKDTIELPGIKFSFTKTQVTG